MLCFFRNTPITFTHSRSFTAGSSAAQATSSNLLATTDPLTYYHGLSAHYFLNGLVNASVKKRRDAILRPVVMSRFIQTTAEIPQMYCVFMIKQRNTQILAWGKLVCSYRYINESFLQYLLPTAALCWVKAFSFSSLNPAVKLLL